MIVVTGVSIGMLGRGNEKLKMVGPLIVGQIGKSIKERRIFGHLQEWDSLYSILVFQLPAC